MPSVGPWNTSPKDQGQACSSSVLLSWCITYPFCLYYWGSEISPRTFPPQICEIFQLHCSQHREVFSLFPNISLSLTVVHIFHRYYILFVFFIFVMYMCCVFQIHTHIRTLAWFLAAISFKNFSVCLSLKIILLNSKKDFCSVLFLLKIFHYFHNYISSLHFLIDLLERNFELV